MKLMEFMSKGGKCVKILY